MEPLSVMLRGSLYGADKETKNEMPSEKASHE